MEQLRLRSNERINHTSLQYQRDEIDRFDWSLRLLGIKGARGVGKTTLLLQHIKQLHGLSAKAIYLSLDDIYFTENRLIDVGTSFHRQGGTHLYLDEVHKYPDWAIEVKNLYDTFPDLKIVFTGSSMLEILKANADLSRRAIVFRLQGLSFRQYMALKHNIELPLVNLDKVLKEPNEIISSLDAGFKPYAYLKEYLKSGYYPFFMEGEQWFYDRLSASVRVVLETDLPSLEKIDIRNVRKIWQLLYIIAGSPPFKPNIQRLSERTGISRNTLIQYLYHLEEADLLSLLNGPSTSLSLLRKPEKVFMSNTNMMYAFHPDRPNEGAIRETFVLNQIRYQHEVYDPENGDFLVDRKFTLEVGGKGKNKRQIAGLDHAFVIADNLDFAVDNKIPLWLFGLLY